MTFEQYWERKKAKNQDLKDSKSLRLSTESFRSELAKAYEQGRAEGKQEAMSGIPSLSRAIFGTP